MRCSRPLSVRALLRDRRSPPRPSLGLTGPGVCWLLRMLVIAIGLIATAFVSNADEFITKVARESICGAACPAAGALQSRFARAIGMQREAVVFPEIGAPDDGVDPHRPAGAAGTGRRSGAKTENHIVEINPQYGEWPGASGLIQPARQSPCRQNAIDQRGSRGCFLEKYM